jgi:hypothetical protein
MSQPVYILLRGDPKKSSLSEDGEKPVGVVSDQKVADRFFAEQTETDPRDWVMFMLDEVAEITGEPGTHEIPEPQPPAPIDRATQRLLDEANRRVVEANRMMEEANQKVQQMLKIVQKMRKR